ncbi:MAG: hydantoinase/oxoprolinase family protein [Rhodospirillales bacterium]|nr:hydantoinase/oxoprolinase family protein [Rhodospirillales bacterium]
MIRVGIDIGGTFTDFAVWRSDAGGEIETFKVPSTPPSFADGVRAGFERILKKGIAPGETVVVVHGTTVSTNTVIERSGARLALLTTKGFKDLLTLQRLRLDKPTDMFNRRAESLIPRRLVYEIDERLRPDGSVETPLAAEDAVAAAKAAAEAGAEGAAICFLHSYRNPAHENAARETIERHLPGFDVTTSSEIWPQQAEYERAIVGILNAYVRPVMNDYLGELDRFFADRVAGARLFITKSNGGAMAAKAARRYPVHTLLSGPASGVTAAAYLGQHIKDGGILTMDMGGTSTDLSLIRNGQAIVSTQAEVGDFPLMMPVTGIEAIGAGGGSIAQLDGTVLAVGPRSAGARPGPACYGKGGTLPTLTDAYLVCGYLDPARFLGGSMPLDRAKAVAALEPLARAMSLGTAEAADACVSVATSNMVAKVLPYLARQGADPRQLSLLLYGGAGGVHGPLLAREIGVERVIVPRTPSVFCAFGGLVTDLAFDAVQTVHGQAVTRAELDGIFRTLETAGRDWLAAQIAANDIASIKVERALDMRYRGQSFQVSVALSAATFERPGLDGIEAAFHAEHERLYSHAEPGAPIQYVEVRVRVVGSMATPPFAAMPPAGTPVADARAGTRAMRFDGVAYDRVPVYERQSLGPGHAFGGPAIVEQGDATVLVPPGFAVTVDPFANLVMTGG